MFEFSNFPAGYIPRPKCMQIVKYKSSLEFWLGQFFYYNIYCEVIKKIKNKTF